MITSLPIQLQLSPSYGVTVGDYDHDGNLDALIVGNSYATEVSTGRYDASIGSFLRGDGKGKFTHVPTLKSGFMVDQDAKGLASLNAADGSELILSGVNNGKLKIHRANSTGKYYAPSSSDAYAIIILKNGAQYKHEFYFGSTYLSSSSRKLRLSNNVSELTVYTFAGEKKTVKP